MNEACGQRARINEPGTVLQPESRRWRFVDTDVLIPFIGGQPSSEDFVQIDYGRASEKETRKNKGTLTHVKFVTIEAGDQ